MKILRITVYNRFREILRGYRFFECFLVLPIKSIIVNYLYILHVNLE